MDHEMFSATSSGSSGINRNQEVPHLNVVAVDSFSGTQNVSSDHPPLPSLPSTPSQENVPPTVPKYFLSEMADYGEPPKGGAFGIVKKMFSSYVGAAAYKTMQRMASMTEKEREQWQREFANIYSLNHHPNIVGLYGYVYANPYDSQPTGILMEYMLGGSLQDFMSSRGHQVEDRVKNTWIKQIALGLNFIHSLNMIHRDIKPDNILLSHDFLIAKIADLGLAKKLTAEMNTMNVGNAVYSAPEVCMGTGEYKKPADIWSYGMLLYYIYYVSHPYDPVTFVRIPPLVRVRVWRGEEKHKTMNRRPELIGYLIDTIIKLCWETEPKDRCTISQIVEQLHSPNGMELFPSLAV